MNGDEENRTPVLDRRGYNLEDSYIISLRISVVKSGFDCSQELIVNLSGGQLNSLLKNLKADTNEFLTKGFIVGKLSNCLMNNGGSKG